MIFGLITIAVIIGALMPIQASINGELSRLTQNPYLAAFISFATGTLALLILLLIKGFPVEEFKRLPSASPYVFLGGALGALFVVSSVFFVPRIGTTTMIAAFVTGQLVMSVVIDHYGMLGLPVNTLTVPRFIGILLLFGGLLLVIKKSP